jgi:GNAT superfamily N-acetyltransferase
MTPAEFAAFRSHAVREYAAAHVRAGHWTAETAQRRAAEETDRLLPQGLQTPAMLLLVGEGEADGVVGTAWVASEQPERVGAWLYDIEIVPEQRGKGYGSGLLAALERQLAGLGVQSLGLNVFADTPVARGLYESSGYEVTSQNMTKTLG